MLPVNLRCKRRHNQALKPTTGSSVLPNSSVASTLLRMNIVPKAHCGLAYSLAPGGYRLFEEATMPDI